MFLLDLGNDFFTILIDSCPIGSNEDSFAFATVRDVCSWGIFDLNDLDGLSMNFILKEENFVLCGSWITL
jgi:hypothetical protein